MVCWAINNPISFLKQFKSLDLTVLLPIFMGYLYDFNLINNYNYNLIIFVVNNAGNLLRKQNDVHVK